MKKTTLLIMILSSVNLCFGSTIGDIYDAYFEGKIAYKTSERTNDGDLLVYQKYAGGLLPSAAVALTGIGLMGIGKVGVNRGSNILNFDYDDDYDDDYDRGLRLIRAGKIVYGIGTLLLVGGAVYCAYAANKYRTAQVPLLVLKKDGILFKGNLVTGPRFVAWNEIEDIVPVHQITFGFSGFGYKTHSFKIVNTHTADIQIKEKDLAITMKEFKSYLIEFLEKHAPEKAEALKLSPLFTEEKKS